MKKKEQEERELRLRQQKERDALLAMRDQKSKNKINKMLKVIKSANKSVLDDAKDNNDTAVTMMGPEQPDDDDYGYVSQEASAFYSKIMQKYSTDVDPNSKVSKTFRAPPAPVSKERLQAIKNSTKADLDEAASGRGRSSHSHSSKPIDSSGGRSKRDDFSSTLSESSNSQKPDKPNKPKPPRPAAPALSFNDILNLAAKKQHEEIVIPNNSNKKSDERLLTKKEKEELMEKEAREKRRQVFKAEQAKSKANGATAKKAESLTSSNGQKSTASQSMKKIPLVQDKQGSSILEQRLKGADNNPNVKKKESVPLKSQAQPQPSVLKQKNNLQQKNNIKVTHNNNNKPSTGGIPSTKQPMRQQDDRRMQQKPQQRSILAEEMRKMKQREQQQQRPAKNVISNKRKILDDSEEEEYDSDMDSFIDDEGAEDVSGYIKEIFGYDKSR